MTGATARLHDAPCIRPRPKRGRADWPDELPARFEAPPPDVAPPALNHRSTPPCATSVGPLRATSWPIPSGLGGLFTLGVPLTVTASEAAKMGFFPQNRRHPPRGERTRIRSALQPQPAGRVARVLQSTVRPMTPAAELLQACGGAKISSPRDSPPLARCDEWAVSGGRGGQRQPGRSGVRPKSMQVVSPWWRCLLQRDCRSVKGW